jgi:hypothetical protein
MWKNDEPSCVELPDDATILAKIVYVMTNPVTARLVKSVDEWPGVCLGPETLGTTLSIERPDVYFSEAGPAPKNIDLEIVPPQPCVARRPLARLQADLRASVAAVENRTAGPFLGYAEVLAQDPFAKPRTPETRPRRRPRVAGVIGAVFLETLKSMCKFWDDHARARRRWLAGDTGVVFPAGTNALARYPGVRVAHYAPS